MDCVIVMCLTSLALLAVLVYIIADDTRAIRKKKQDDGHRNDAG